MLNRREKSATLAVLLFFSAILSCLCLILVFHFIKELILVTTKNKPSNNNSINNNHQQQEILWAGFSFALVIVFAFTFVVFAIFSGCVMIQEIDTCNNKIAPAPITTDHDLDHHRHPPTTV
ncbi:hypothetical protein PIB30_059413 [Stylosanthes scabra]|uniref:Uncharacterized protein n=1 Tax=Stylosanthes scabra TaxID=79078 RepID=A0ABU6YMR9_9FABA|nr:hypothetical protein [Stylosanthes scabra]